MNQSNPKLPAKGEIFTAIGLMSGTSMDGIDVALVKSDGESTVERGASEFFAYDPSTRTLISNALEIATQIKERKERPGNLKVVEQEVTRLHVNAVKAFLNQHGLNASDIKCLGFHGQTVFHQPQNALTVQLGDGQMLSDETGIMTLYDMRANDMTFGGQGAPLVPVYHSCLANALAGSFVNENPCAFVNIGGISNITFVDKTNDDLLAFDCGPGNALLDQWVQSNAGIPYDQGGAIASEGGLLQPLLRKYLRDPFFDRKVPKSLDRNDFLPPQNNAANLEDGARTLARVTAESIFKSVDHLPQMPKLWIVCGGGRHHPSIMADLNEIAAVHGSKVIAAEEAGFDGDAMEAEAFGYLAIRCLKSLPITFPGTTGASRAVSGGVIALPSSAKS